MILKHESASSWCISFTCLEELFKLTVLVIVKGVGIPHSSGIALLSFPQASQACGYLARRMQLIDPAGVSPVSTCVTCPEANGTVAAPHKPGRAAAQRGRASVTLVGLSKQASGCVFTEATAFFFSPFLSLLPPISLPPCHPCHLGS